MDLSARRTAIKTKLETISGLRAYGTWPDSVNFPAAIVMPLSIDYRTTYDDASDITWQIMLIVSPMQSGMARAQDALDAYLDNTGSSSIKAAIEAGGTHDVLRMRDYGTLEVPPGSGALYFGCVFDVEEYA